MLDAVALELVTVGCTEDFVTSNLGGDNLANDILVGEANDEAVFGGIVFVFGLCNKALAGVVISLASTTALVLGLEATTVSLARGPRTKRAE